MGIAVKYAKSCLHLFLCLSSLIACKSGEKEKIRPNVLIILTDDQGWGDLSFTGNPNLKTPNIDKLGVEGISFDKFYVSPVCSPTRAEMLTGRYHLRGGVSGTSAGQERLDLDEVTFAEVLKNSGYVTGAFGKWHNGMQYPYHPNGRGFDEFYGFCSGHWGDYFSPPLEHNGKPIQGEGFLANDLTSKAMAFIEENQEQPFLVYLPLNTPHSPMQVPDRWYDSFANKELDSLVNGEDQDFTKAALAMCENIDWNVGRIMDQLKSLNLEENTIVIYFSDNGPNRFRWNGGMKGRKGSTDEGGVRSPFFMQWKGTISGGEVIEEISGAIDLFPTLIDMLGLAHKSAKPFDGISLKPLIFKEATNWDDRIIYRHWNNRTSLRTQNFLLDHEGALFEMNEDPYQKNPVQHQYPEVSAKLIAAKTTWEKEMDEEQANDPEFRPFTLGASEAIYTQMPARDGTAYGQIQRSNRFPNDSFFTNWVTLQDSITWEVEVLTAGKYAVELYYTCPQKDIGATFRLQVGKNILDGKVTLPHDPLLKGEENDRVKRMESYVKDFKAMSLGEINLDKGEATLSIKALDIPGSQVMDLRLIVFTKRN
ncbi:arylsulfatase [uncultured Cyclobacterium sp.]|uniref:arylsulfatase n=1 Tax=uncultured Cyclobacterium sp. TaxID=453820 RepID=UPI0030EB2C67|tara:strand:+ start:165975 stop:167753 length:1779 start_codon:yes stop_codon:yes gene_type:complete